MRTFIALVLVAGPLVWEALHQRRLERERLARLEQERLFATARRLIPLFVEVRDGFIQMGRAFGKSRLLLEALARDLATDR